MQFLAFFDDYAEKITNGDLSDSDLSEIKNLIDFKDSQVSGANIGPGADLMTILVTINTVANVFLIGQQIDAGIDGWINLGNRLKKMFRKKQLVAIDKDAASLLAIEFLNSKEKIQSLVKTHEHEINWIRLDGMLLDRKPEDFISKPHAYFVQTYLINSQKYYILGITSQGKVELIKCFDAGNPYGLQEI